MTARKLVLSHMARAVRNTRREADNAVAASDDADEPPPLLPNQMRLYSYYKPSLEAGNYTIEVTQNISSGDQSLEIRNSRTQDASGSVAPQEFEVVVPRFSLDRNLINSYYPPDGHQDEGRILPHISFNDPHYPWEILAGTSSSVNGANHDGLLDDGRSMVPWVALLVFDPEELKIPDLQSAQALGIPGIQSQADLLKQTPTGTFGMAVSDYLNLPHASRVNYEADSKGFQESKTMQDQMNVIFPPKQLLARLFSRNAGVPGSQALDLQAQRYMAHVRHINTEGFPEAGVEEEGLFSIVVSNRTGTWNKPDPTTQICHLVSIEHFDSTIGDWENTTDRIGIVSLFSWIYTSLPPNPVNFITTMKNLTENRQQLRVDDQTIDSLLAVPGGDVKSQVSKILADRLRMGYSVSRWRTQTGEETAAFNRGPLVPLPMPPGTAPDKPWPAALDLVDCSNTSQSYQILDPETGLLDLSYSSAWQTGKLLAISDTVFNSALMRFRSAVHNSATSQTNMSLNGMVSKRKLFESLQKAIDITQQKSGGQTSAPERFRPANMRQGEASTKSSTPTAMETWRTAVSGVTRSNTLAENAVFDEFNLSGPNNSDWVIVHNWLSEKLLLGGITPQYLLPDPSFLLAESLRFFYIDDFWLDCFLDGALSVANHLDSDDDSVRREIKTMYNEYLRTPVTDSGGIKPQIPCYGFIIRSILIKAMPDLRITVSWKTPDNGRHPVCRWTRWDDQTLMALLDRMPQELDRITITQPQHQKRFSLGASIDSDTSSPPKITVSFPLRQLYTEDTTDPPPADKPWPLLQENDAMTTPWLNKTTRGLEITKMAVDINQALRKDAVHYTDQTPNSVELGFELNDNCYFFDILPDPNGMPPIPAPRDRQLYVRTPPPVQPAQALSAAPAAIITPSPASKQPQPAGLTPLATNPLPRPPHGELKIQPWPQSSLSHGPTPAVHAPVSAAATLQARFDLQVFADYKGPPKRFPQDKYDANDYLAAQNIYFYDLVFSIRKKLVAQVSQYQLLKIVIDIPVASTPPDTHTEALLTPTYDGEGVRMLANQRFVPFLFNDDPGQPLHVELVPRSANDDYAIILNDRKTTELGFRLAEANISPVVVSTLVDIDGERQRQPRGKVSITMTEYYSTPAFPRGEPVASKYTVIKWAKQDDVDIG